jgi:hypothetical protein
MRIAALFVALFAIVVGVVGILLPDSLMTIGRYVVTPVGLYAIAALRIVVGLVLMLVAPISRVPRTLRVVGAVVVVAGFLTLLVGFERTRAILDWEVTQGTAFTRVLAVLILAVGGFIAFAVTTGRRPKAEAR